VIVNSWDLKALDLKPRLPEILSSSDVARAIVLDLAAGESLSDHQVHERAWLVVLDGESYGRVSTRDQHPEAQHDALAAAGCEQIFIETASGKLARRPQMEKALLSANRAGDQLVVTKLDRLGRSLEHLIELSRQLQEREVDLVVLDQGIDTSTAVGRLFFQIIGAIAEFEHALMSERTMDGLAAARARGRTGGQKPKLGPRQVKLAREMYDETGEDGKRKHTVATIAAEFGVSRPTIYRHLGKTTGPDSAAS
jgi:DNA invertase Pin-like site-specific DNA recombinase